MQKKPNKTTMRSQIVKRVIICGLILLAGILGMLFMASLRTPPAEAKIEERALRVEVAQMQAEDVPVAITAYGEVKALNTVAIAPEVMGRITYVHPRLDVGEIIPANDILFRIDARDYQAAYDESVATVAQLQLTIKRLQKQQEIDTRRLKTLERNRDLAQSEFERVQTLFREHQVGTRSGVDRAEQAYNVAVDQADQMAQTVALYPIHIQEQQSRLTAARAGLTKTRADLARCGVRAPFAGRITMAAIEANQYVVPGQSVVTLTDDSLLEIHLALDSRDARQWLQFDDSSEAARNGWIGQLKPVDCRIYWTEDKSADGWAGRLHRVVKFEAQTRTLTVAVRVKTHSPQKDTSDSLPLVEGMFCEVTIPGRMLPQVYQIPRKAVTLDQTVYLSESSRLKTVPVNVVRYNSESAIVDQGLSDGDQVITTRLVDPLENSLLKITNIGTNEK